MDSRHGIKKDDRQELMAAVKSLVHSRTKVDFFRVWEMFKAQRGILALEGTVGLKCHVVNRIY